MIRTTTDLRSTYLGKQFHCPDCGRVIKFMAPVEIKFTDICPDCYNKTLMGQTSTRVKTCLAAHTKTLLND